MDTLTALFAFRIPGSGGHLASGCVLIENHPHELDHGVELRERIVFNGDEQRGIVVQRFAGDEVIGIRDGVPVAVEDLDLGAAGEIDSFQARERSRFLFGRHTYQDAQLALCQVSSFDRARWRGQHSGRRGLSQQAGLRWKDPHLTKTFLIARSDLARVANVLFCLGLELQEKLSLRCRVHVVARVLRGELVPQLVKHLELTQGAEHCPAGLLLFDFLHLVVDGFKRYRSVQRIHFDLLPLHGKFCQSQIVVGDG